MTDIPTSRALRPPKDWEPVFAGNPNAAYFGTEPSALARSALRYLEAFGNKPADCIALDLGSGEGRDTVFLASAGLRVVARDIAPSGVAKTRTRLTQAGIDEGLVDIALADVREYDYPDQFFDIAMSANVFQFLTPDEARDGIEKLKRTAKPGGIVALGVFSPAMAGWGTDISPFFTATADDLLAFFPSADGWLLCDRTEYWTYRVDNDTLGSFAFVVARRALS
jgi:SAM-dependent methyltransferase